MISIDLTKEYNILPVIVSFQTQDWMKVGLCSFHEHFPNTNVLVVDNNPGLRPDQWDSFLKALSLLHQRIGTDNTTIQEEIKAYRNRSHLEEREWIRNYDKAHVIENNLKWSHSDQIPPAANNALHEWTFNGKQHGAALDVAVEYCKENGIKYMLNIEPDCLISGTKWFEKLHEKIKEEAWYTGALKKFYGPIHPCPSIIDVDSPVCDVSFCIQPKTLLEMEHPRFEELYGHSLKPLMESVDNPEWWKSMWDSTQRNWYIAALHDKALLVDDYNEEGLPTLHDSEKGGGIGGAYTFMEYLDFVHFWIGHHKSPQRVCGELKNLPDSQRYVNKLESYLEK